MRARRIKVMIVEDSPTQSLLLEEIINADPRLQVVAVAGSAEKALRVMARVRPDVVSMDIHLPKMDGYQATRQIMQDYPLPIVVVSSSVGGKDAEISVNSLRAGALAVVKRQSASEEKGSTFSPPGRTRSLARVQSGRDRRFHRRTSGPGLVAGKAAFRLSSPDSNSSAHERSFLTRFYRLVGRPMCSTGEAGLGW